MKCCICDEKIEKELSGWDGGHNAEPVASGRCCQNCNETMVVPARIEQIYGLR